jgi:putative SOS response-associated peptidase YedK
MCGRFNLTATPEQISETFHLQGLLDFEVRYNITPGQVILAIVPVDDLNRSNETNKAVHLLWGLIPSWSKDRKMSHSLINARAETLSEKPSFRTAFQKRRTLIPATVFFEWRQTEQGKQAYHITRPDQQVFAFAGLWKHWEQGGDTVYSCTIVTTAANTLMQPIHTRMPVIIAPEQYNQWLDHQTTKDWLLSLLIRIAYESMKAIPVSNWVNNPRHNDSRCIEAMSLT